jgi:hypothetical protein
LWSTSDFPLSVPFSYPSSPASIVPAAPATNLARAKPAPAAAGVPPQAGVTSKRTLLWWSVGHWTSAARRWSPERRRLVAQRKTGPLFGSLCFLSFFALSKQPFSYSSVCLCTFLRCSVGGYFFMLPNMFRQSWADESRGSGARCVLPRYRLRMISLLSSLSLSLTIVCLRVFM